MKLSTFFKYLNPKYLLSCRTGTCPICCRRTAFLVLDEPETIRNHALCIWCKSSSRHRHVALSIIRKFQGEGIRRLSDFSRKPGITVFNTSTQSHVAKALGKAGNIIHSEFFDDTVPGGYKNGVLNQDLRDLTFPDSSIDLVISEDVLEHVPELKRGLKEVHRVLKNGGVHVFSIPFHFDRRTKELFTSENGKISLLEPVEYHGDPVRGSIPCYAYIGYDILDYLDDMGFETRIDFSRYADELKFGTFDCFTFITTKTR